MKMTKKKVFLAALAVCLVAIISMSTLAWFSDSDSVTNNFFVTNSDQDADAIFSVDVTENVADPGANPKPVNGYDFKDILPGDKLVKQPFVTNKGSYDQFVRVTVTISDYNAFNAVLGEKYPVASLFGGLNWGYDGAQLVLDSHTEDKAGDGKLVYVFYVNEIVSPGESVRLFDKVLIPYQLEQADVANTSLKDGFSIDIFAEAVQTENVGTAFEDLPTANAANAKLAFEYVAFFS